MVIELFANIELTIVASITSAHKKDNCVLWVVVI